MARFSKVRYLLGAERKALALALRAAALPATLPFRRGDRLLVARLWDVCWGSLRRGVYPEVELTSLMSRDDEVRLLDLPAEVYHIADSKLLAVAALARRARPRIAFEMGTADGRTTRNLAANLDTEGHVYTLSLPLEQDPIHADLQSVPIGTRLRGTPEEGRTTQLLGDSRTFDFAPYRGRCGLVFIDADNAEHSVLANSRTALDLVDRESAVILWNDALSFGTRVALPRLMRQGGLPIHLIAGKGLGLLCFAGGAAVTPQEWADRLDRAHTAPIPSLSLNATGV